MTPQQTDSALRTEIADDAREAGHNPGPWVPTGKRWYIACVRCGEEAIIVNQECEIDNMQDRCRGHR